MKNIDPKIIKIVSIALGVIISIGIIVGGWKILTAGSRAAQETATSVAIENITQDSVTITWEAAEGSQGVVVYGTTSTALNFFAPEPSNTTGTKHSVDLTLLSPNTTYYFTVKIGMTATDESGFPFQFKTKGNEAAVTPTLAPTVIKNQSIIIPPKTNAPTLAPIGSCNETDCDKIKAKLGRGCTTQDYFLCLRGAGGGQILEKPVTAPGD